VPSGATAFPWRRAQFCLQLLKYFKDPTEAENVTAALNEVQLAMAPYFPGLPAYVNYIDAEVSDKPMQSYYGPNIGWLKRVKRRYDPTNLFSTNPLAIPAATDREVAAGLGSGPRPRRPPQ
jgi:hypothetical protein